MAALGRDWRTRGAADAAAVDGGRADDGVTCEEAEMDDAEEQLCGDLALALSLGAEQSSP